MTELEKNLREYFHLLDTKREDVRRVDNDDLVRVENRLRAAVGAVPAAVRKVGWRGATEIV